MAWIKLFSKPICAWMHDQLLKLRAHEHFGLTADLRRAFSGIVAGNVKEEGMQRVEEFGPYQIHGDADIMQALDALLRAFVEQRRMKIMGQYKPCYQIVA